MVMTKLKCNSSGRDIVTKLTCVRTLSMGVRFEATRMGFEARNGTSLEAQPAARFTSSLLSCVRQEIKVSRYCLNCRRSSLVTQVYTRSTNIYIIILRKSRAKNGTLVSNKRTVVSVESTMSFRTDTVNPSAAAVLWQS